MRRAWRGLGPEAAVLALAAVLRLAALGRVPTNPYYDAAVRSMGTSWAAFLSGAFEPGRRVAIDKPPVDLWLQVASTRLLGFNGVALLAPEALGGIALVAALMWLLRTLLGRTASLAGGLALAVAPSAVIVARSDTMDAVMAALAVAGAAVVARAARSGSRWPLVGAGVLLGLAFEVKLAEALLPVAAAAALWWFAGPRARRPRAVGLGLLGGAFVASALAWLVVVSVVPLHPRPWALGSSDGSPWRAALVYNGTARLLGEAATHRARLRAVLAAGAASPWRVRRARGRDANSPLRVERRRHGPPPPRLLAARASTRPPWRAARRPPDRCACCPPRPIWAAGSASRPWRRWRRSPSRWRSAGRAASAASSAAGCSPSRSGWSPAWRCAARCPVCARATWPASILPSRPAWERASRSPSARARAPRAWRAPPRCARYWPCRWPQRRRR